MRKLMALVVVSAAFVLGGLFINGTASAAASGCDEYAIMRCGASSPSEFISKTRNGRADLKDIYSDFGLVPAEYAKFASSAKHGTIYDDGRIVVDGAVVGHSNLNIGRVRDANFNQRVSIAGNDYWGGPFGSTYHANTADVMVMFDDRGVMQFAVISSCGNPQRFTPTRPTYSCNNLIKNPVSGKENTYTFTTRASASRGAEVVRAVYDFGDGDTRTVTDLSQPVTHTFTKTSTRVTVYVRVPGGSVVTTTGADCLEVVRVKEAPNPEPTPVPQCVRLDVTPLDAVRRTYRFTAIANFDKSLTFTGANFTFGDGVTINGVKPNGSQAIIEHTYAKSGTYEVKAVLNFSDGTTTTAAECGATVTPTEVIQYCKPGIPVGSKECETVPEQQLTKTGPGAIVAGIVGFSSVAAGIGHFFIRRHFLG